MNDFKWHFQTIKGNRIKYLNTPFAAITEEGSRIADNSSKKAYNLNYSLSHSSSNEKKSYLI